MTAPTDTAPEAPEIVEDADGKMRVTFPVLALEGKDTGDGRFITPGGLSSRDLPLSLLAQPYAPHGGQDAPAAEILGKITSVARHNGPDVVSRRTGEPFPEGVFVWSAEGEIDGGHKWASLIRDQYLRGVSVDLAGLDAEIVGEEAAGMSDTPQRRVIMHTAEIAAATLVPIQAFGDAYCEVAGEDPVEPLVASAIPPELGLMTEPVPSFRSADIDDECGLCLAGLTAAVDDPPAVADVDVDPGDLAELADRAAPVHTGGMVALLPANPEQLAVPGGDPADEMHLTVSYLGDDVTRWDERRRAEVLAAVTRFAGEEPKIEARVFGHALLNPDGGPDGDRDACAVYLVGDSPRLSWISGTAAHVVRDVEQHEPFLPHVTAGYGLELSALTYTGPVVFDRIRLALGGEHTDLPLVGHRSMFASGQSAFAMPAAKREKAEEAGHTLPGTDKFPIETADDLDNAIKLAGSSDEDEGKVKAHIRRQAKRLGLEERIPDSWAAEDTESLADGQTPPLGADDDDDDRGKPKAAVTAAAADGRPPAEWFTDPQLDGPTPLTITEDGRVYGTLAAWNVCHIGMQGPCTTAPRSASSYAYFRTGAVHTADGTEVPVGSITMDTGHAGTSLGHTATAFHYDNTGSVVADVAAGEDQHGIWVAGAIRPGVDEATVDRLRASALSGDWRRIGSSLELVAALSVNVPGFPVPRARVASGSPQALVAAGSVHATSETPPGELAALRAEIASLQARMDVQQYADEQAALVAELDDTGEVVASLVSDLDDSDVQVAALLAELDGDDSDGAFLSRMPPHLQKSYLTGKVAARIRWGTSGDWTRCRRQGIKHGMTPHQAAGACNTLHKKANGFYPGDKRNR